MSHKNKDGLFKQVYDRLQSMNGQGRSKHKDKENGVSNRYIYSFESMKTYISQAKIWGIIVKM